MLKKITLLTGFTSLVSALSINNALAMRMHLSAPPPDYFWLWLSGIFAGAAIGAIYIKYLLYKTNGGNGKCPECGQPKPATKKVADHGESVPAKQ